MSTGFDNLFPSECPECGSKHLTWDCHARNHGGVQDGRIRMNEVGVSFFVGCDECSETVKVVSGDVIAALLTNIQKGID